MGSSARRKGAEGERELAAFLRERGIEATRNARNGISTDDIAHSLEGIHLEVKRTERAEPLKWSRQAEKDAGDRVPVVVWRSNGEPWRVILRAEHFLHLIGEAR